MALTLASDVQDLSGIGAKRAEQLAGLGIRSIGDLVHHLPFRFIDRSRPKPIAEFRVGEQVTARVTVDRIRPTTTKRRNVPIVEVTVRDDSGVLTVTFFNTKIPKVIKEGDELLLTGTADFHRELRLTQPEFEVIDPTEARPLLPLKPIYHASEELPPYVLAPLIPAAVEEVLPAITDPVPEACWRERGMLGQAEAVRLAHAPRSMLDVEAARRRLVFTEFFLLEAGLARRRVTERPPSAPPLFDISDRVHDAILARFPWPLTNDQQKACAQVRRDMTTPGRMSRLLQGDVGSGKTAVALYALLAGVAAGFQGAVLAPTEVLARQHYSTMRRMLDGSDVRFGFLSAALNARARDSLLRRLRAGEVDILVGTHALLEDGVRFRQLGVIIVDEQHKFGVMQREALAKKGDAPHIMVLTATPIPRTLAMTLYGDLDTSVIREKPPGFRDPETVFVPPAREDNAFALARDRIRKGEQVFVVYPVVQDNPDSDLQSVMAMATRLRADDRLGADTEIAVLHGGLKPDEKDAVMKRFTAGHVPAMVASTVVEVGVDVPGATVMMITHAERFGLAQLHQLRGRVGRSADRPAWCFLLGNPQTDDAKQRLRTIVRTNDGFKIAEVDLKLRGFGEFFGTRQHGLPRLRVADIARDADILFEAREEARRAAEEGWLDPTALDTAIRAHFGPEIPLTTVG